MPNFTDFTGLASVASVLATLPLPWAKRFTRPHLALLMGSIFVVALIPFSGFPLAAYVRGATGDLSITTMVLLWCGLMRPWLDCPAHDSRNRLALLALLGFAAVTLYPLALGWGAFDPYRLGYGNAQFVAALLLFSLAAWFWKLHLIVLCLALATLCWAIGWYESGNLWDYLLDPFVAVYALAAIISHVLKRQLDR